MSKVQTFRRRHRALKVKNVLCHNNTFVKLFQQLNSLRYVTLDIKVTLEYYTNHNFHTSELLSEENALYGGYSLRRTICLILLLKVFQLLQS